MRSATTAYAGLMTTTRSISTTPRSLNTRSCRCKYIISKCLCKHGKSRNFPTQNQGGKNVFLKFDIWCLKSFSMKFFWNFFEESQHLSTCWRPPELLHVPTAKCDCAVHKVIQCALQCTFHPNYSYIKTHPNLNPSTVCKIVQGFKAFLVHV